MAYAARPLLSAYARAMRCPPALSAHADAMPYPGTDIRFETEIGTGILCAYTTWCLEMLDARYCGPECCLGCAVLSSCMVLPGFFTFVNVMSMFAIIVFTISIGDAARSAYAPAT
eukprot:1687672-Rhodomonas_salina.1